jgi:Family of unknown function (DUF6232)
VAEEVSVYRDGNIQITNLRAILHDKTYAMANITSVSTFRQDANTAPGIVLTILGGLVLLGGLGSNSAVGCALIFGLPMFVVGLIIGIAAKHVYWVRIGSASGETNALRSNDRAYIQRIVDAMNEAIVRRG